MTEKCNWPDCKCPFDMGADSKCWRGFKMPNEAAAIPEADAVGLSAVERLVIPNVTGYVTYDVAVDCPHCKKKLYLNQYPYDDDESEYRPAEDQLGLALFGRANDPAKWEGLDIEYQCCGCEKLFYLKSLAT